MDTKNTLSNVNQNICCPLQNVRAVSPTFFKNFVSLANLKGKETQNQY